MSIETEIEQIKESVKELTSLVESLRDVVPKKEKQPRKKRSPPVLNDIDKMIMQVIDEASHPLLEKDLVKPFEIVQVLNTLHPEYSKFFNDERRDRSGILLVERRVAARLGRIGKYKSILMCHYDPEMRKELIMQGKGGRMGGTRAERVWAVRNISRYETMAPSQLYHEYYDQFDRAIEKIRQQKRQEESFI